MHVAVAVAFLLLVLLLHLNWCDARATAAGGLHQARDMSSISQNYFIDEKKIRQRLKSREDSSARARRQQSASTVDQRARRQVGQTAKNVFSAEGLDEGRLWPKVNLIFDPLINFKIKQRFNMLGACVTVGTLRLLPHCLAANDC